MTKSPTAQHLVIYADDDQDDLDLVRDSFDKYAQDVHLVTFDEGQGALDYLTSIADSKPGPCLIILDINLPGLSGKEILQRIRQIEAYQTTPVVLFTTSSQPTDKAFAREYAAGFMTKPLSYRQMDIITEQFIEHCTDDIKKKIRKQTLGH